MFYILVAGLRKGVILRYFVVKTNYFISVRFAYQSVKLGKLHQRQVCQMLKCFGNSHR